LTSSPPQIIRAQISHGRDVDPRQLYAATPRCLSILSLAMAAVKTGDRILVLSIQVMSSIRLLDHRDISVHMFLISYLRKGIECAAVSVLKQKQTKSDGNIPMQEATSNWLSLRICRWTEPLMILSTVRGYHISAKCRCPGYLPYRQPISFQTSRQREVPSVAGNQRNNKYSCLRA
jgi:aerobic-type carbon monoxide dehydrogenase small subunit (CoxS/CutS family)